MKLYLIRGLPGSGKSTFAQQLIDGGDAFHIEADQFFMVDGVYRFDVSNLKDAHKWCQDECASLMRLGARRIIVSNTFSQQWEIDPYLAMMKEYRYEGKIFDLFDDGFTDGELSERNTHGVPEGVIAAMRSRWEHDLIT